MSRATRENLRSARLLRTPPGKIGGKLLRTRTELAAAWPHGYGGLVSPSLIRGGQGVGTLAVFAVDG